MMQELMVYAGQLDCYGRSNEVIKQFLQVDVSAAQVYRVTDTYGEELGKTVNEEKTLAPIKQQEVLYAEVDWLHDTDARRKVERSEGGPPVQLIRVREGN